MDKVDNVVPFYVKDCTLVSCMGGVEPAMNLRELRERMVSCPLESLFHHFCETVLRSSFDDPEFRNDFAVWAARQLRDRSLAERLGSLNPYEYKDLEDLRRDVISIIDDRLGEIEMIPWARRGAEFRFMKAVTVVFDTDIVLRTPQDLITALPNMTNSTIYFHFVESHRRPPLHNDDFSAWLGGFGDETSAIIAGLQSIDFYYLSLRELKQELMRVLNRFKSAAKHVS